MSRKTYQLVPDTISHDMVSAMEHLLLGARSGEYIGIAFAVMLKGKKYIVNTAGEAQNSPTFVRGMLSELDDSLSYTINKYQHD